MTSISISSDGHPTVTKKYVSNASNGKDTLRQHSHYGAKQPGADLGQNFRGRQELWNNFAINDRGKFLVLML